MGYEFKFDTEYFEPKNQSGGFFGNPKSYDIALAKKIISKKSRPPKSISVEEFYRDESREMEAIKRHVFDDRIDLTFPVICITTQSGKLKIIDGMHRLFKAKVCNIKTLPAFILTFNETLEVLGEDLLPRFTTKSVSLGASRIWDNEENKFQSNSLPSTSAPYIAEFAITNWNNPKFRDWLKLIPDYQPASYDEKEKIDSSLMKFINGGYKSLGFKARFLPKRK